MIRIVTVAALLVLAGCGGSGRDAVARGEPPLYPNETPELRRLINYYADVYDVPASLIHRSIDRESDYRVDARAGPYYGLMQILPQTARTMGHRGPASELLDADTNLRYAVRYLRGAWLLSDGDEAEAIGWYARGYYYEARDRCMLVETGLNDREIARRCRG
ncbi:MAG: transglycosylase SLT domain-containing protein [Alterinioella nitratireducens]|uniref:transglycosylase SLT domain-containing protein n=1 Tax=Alterinioella nitratireducens TaxID=2735915 RepID=UPI004059926B